MNGNSFRTMRADAIDSLFVPLYMPRLGLVAVELLLPFFRTCAAVQRRIRRFRMLTVAVALSSLLTVGAVAEPRPLSKSDAVKILQGMGYQRITVAYIIQGAVPMAATQNAAIVTGMGQLNGQLGKIDRQFFYDNDLGWFYSEDGIDKNTGQITFLKIWSVSGYSVITQAPPPNP